MLDKFLKEVVGMLVGKSAEDIVDLLNSTKHVNEFIIAKKLDLTINQTRNILYRIGDQGLVSFIRKKDKKKGWYTYFWKIEVLKSLEYLRKVLVKRQNHIQKQIKNRETKQFYFCERCNIEVDDEMALQYNFFCSECGDVFVLRENEKVLKELNKVLNRINSQIADIDVEIEKEQVKLDKAKQKELDKIAKEKDEKRAERAAARKKAKKIAKRVTKNVAKKKVVKKKTAGKSVKKKVAKKKAKKKTVKKVAKKKVSKRGQASPKRSSIQSLRVKKKSVRKSTKK